MTMSDGVGEVEWRWGEGEGGKGGNGDEQRDGVPVSYDVGSLDSSDRHPSPRASAAGCVRTHAAAGDDNNSVYVYGGLSFSHDDSPTDNDDDGGGTTRWETGKFGDVWVRGGEEGEWEVYKEYDSSGGRQPVPRAESVSGYDSASDSLVIYGGLSIDSSDGDDTCDG